MVASIDEQGGEPLVTPIEFIPSQPYNGPSKNWMSVGVARISPALSIFTSFEEGTVATMNPNPGSRYTDLHADQKGDLRLWYAEAEQCARVKGCGIRRLLAGRHFSR